MFNVTIFLCLSIRIRKRTQKVGFYIQLWNSVTKTNVCDSFVICVSFSGCIRKVADGCKSLHSRHDYDLRNSEGEHILRYNPKSKHKWWKCKCSECQQSQEVQGWSKSPQQGLRGQGLRCCIIQLNYGEVCKHAYCETNRTCESCNNQGTKMSLLSDEL